MNDLTGTDLTAVNVDLGSSAGSATGDIQADRITVNGTNGDDVITATTASGVTTVVGLTAVVKFNGADANGLGGADVIDASGLETDIKLSTHGGIGVDVLIGSAGNDLFIGGAGDDVLIGGPGVDVLDGGPGDNVVIQG